MAAMPDELVKLGETYDRIVADATAGRTTPAQAISALSANQVTDGAGAVWAYDQTGTLTRAADSNSGPVAVPDGDWSRFVSTQPTPPAATTGFGSPDANPFATPEPAYDPPPATPTPSTSPPWASPPVSEPSNFSEDDNSPPWAKHGHSEQVAPSPVPLTNPNLHTGGGSTDVDEPAKRKLPKMSLPGGSGVVGVIKRNLTMIIVCIVGIGLIVAAINLSDAPGSVPASPTPSISANAGAGPNSQTITTTVDAYTGGNVEEAVAATAADAQISKIPASVKWFTAQAKKNNVVTPSKVAVTDGSAVGTWDVLTPAGTLVATIPVTWTFTSGVWKLSEPPTPGTA